MKKTGPFVLIWVCLMLMPAAASGFQVSARVDKTVLTQEDTLILQVVVQGGGGDVDVKGIRDFKVLSSGTSTSRSYANGKWDHRVSYQYRLVPLKKGQLVIPRLRVVQKGQEAFTQKIVVRVKDLAAPETGERPFFAKARVSRPDPFMGQQILYTFQLFAGRRFSGASLDGPDFEGFSVQEIQDRKNYDRVINGVAYMVTEVNYILTPQTQGEITIEPGVVMAEVVVRSRKDPFGSVFDDPFFNNSVFSSARTKTLRIVSNKVALKVSPMPPYDGKKDFSGLVGRFSLEADLDKTALSAGESATLTVTLSGTGNIMDGGMPKLDMDPARFKVYEDAPVEKIEITEKGAAGQKTFKRALVPLKPGRVEIPPLFMTYFDPDRKRYVELSTNPMVLDVAAGTDKEDAPGQEAQAPASRDVVKKDVVLINRDILDIREDVAILNHQGRPDFILFLGLVMAPGLGFGIMALAMGRRKREKSASRVMKDKAKAHLKQARNLDPGDEAVLSHLHSALNAAVLSRADRKGESLTREETGRILDQAGAGPDTVQKVNDMFETLDGARFGGKPMDKAAVKRCLEGITRVLRLSLAIVMVMGVINVSASRAQTPSLSQPKGHTGLFVSAIKSYKAGAYADAAKNFEAIAASGIVNGDLYYNIGNAYFKDQDLGRAILWYERAKKLSPNDPDLAFNLDHARSLVTDRVEDPFSWEQVFFFWQGVIPVSWIMAAAAAGSWIFFIWGGICLFRKTRVLSGPGIVLALIPIFLTLALGLGYYRDKMVSHAVIVQTMVPVKSGTANASTRLFDLHAGTRVRVKDRKNGFLKIMFTREKIGWVKQGDAIVI